MQNKTYNSDEEPNNVFDTIQITRILHRRYK